MSAPYDGVHGGDGESRGENRGYLQADAGHLRDAIIAAHRAGWRVAAHAIGDRAIDLALDAFEAAAARYPRPDPRHRIEHFAAARPDPAAGVPFNAGEAVTAHEALRACTWGSAYASAAERVKGSVEVGKLADFAVLSEDPVAVSPGRIAGLEVIATIIDGKLSYSALD